MKKPAKTPPRTQGTQDLSSDPSRFATLTRGLLAYFADIDWSVYESRVAELVKLLPEYADASELEVDPEFFADWEGRVRKEGVADPALIKFIQTMRHIAKQRQRRGEATTTLAQLYTDYQAKAHPEIRVSFNWAPYLADLRKDAPPAVFTPFKGLEAKPEFGPVMPHEVPAVITIRVSLTHMTAWGVKAITTRIGDILRDALKNRPTFEEAPTMAKPIPAERQFLLHCREEEFRRDIERYKLHMQEGLSFRQIAYLEWARKQGKRIDARSLPRIIGLEVPGESSVRESIRRLYEAIYLQPYKARRRRIDAPAEGVEKYRCAEHGQGCPDTCEHMQGWFEKIDRMLPTDTTGKGKGEVKLEAIHAARRRRSKRTPSSE